MFSEILLTFELGQFARFKVLNMFPILRKLACTFSSDNEEFREEHAPKTF